MKKYIYSLFFIVIFIASCSKGSSSSNPTPANPSSGTVAVEVDNLSPQVGTYNTTISILGRGFSLTATENKVFVNGVQATVISATSIPGNGVALQALVPFGAGSGAVGVSVNNGSAISGPVFTYQLPNTVTKLTSFTSSFDMIFGTPEGIAIDAAGNAYVADSGNRIIYKITPTGAVNIYAGHKTNPGHDDGIATVATFSSPGAVAIDLPGNLYVVDGANIRKITPNGTVSTLAGNNTIGNTDGAGTLASFNSPAGIAVDATGTVYVADNGNNSIRKITPAGTVSTIAKGFKPVGITLDNSGNMFVSDYDSHIIRKVTQAGVVSTFAGSGTTGSADGTTTSASFVHPSALTIDAAGNLYIADMDAPIIRKITPGGVVNTFYNPSNLSGGAANPVYIAYPHGLAIDAANNVYVSAITNNNIAKLKEITTK
ncbi:MAG TPA: IPT/TIG domain-containing protein [Mucilaginibacter sp.]|jgi:sugar lactone lactonase YvrE|nr:IPT/TIG domain-containing protein [Mucilaginibacter sp.]